MALRVEIVSRESIKPSSPTPRNLRNFKLSVFDQLVPSIYVPVIFFYRPTNEQRSCRLKKSLSETLSLTYPLAGRLKKDDFSIECNDEGADFILAKVSEDMSMVVENPSIDMFLQLLPCDPLGVPSELNDQPLLAVQINHFVCGGMAIGFCVRHEIADASTIATLLQVWAAIAREENAPFADGFVIDQSASFPPQNVEGIRNNIWVQEEMVSKTVAKRFVFDASKISALREKATLGTSAKPPTRVEAVSAFLWAAVLAAVRERKEAVKLHVMSSAVGLRKILHPPMPPRSIGNIVLSTSAQWAAMQDEDLIDYKVLVERVHDSIQMVKDEHVRNIQEMGGKFLDLAKTGYELLAKSGNHQVDMLLTSSWCRIPFYEIDFGWGKPIWVACAWKLLNVAVFMDTSDGEGIEAWLGLSEEDMEKLELNHDFLAHVSSCQTL